MQVGHGNIQLKDEKATHHARARLHPKFTLTPEHKRIYGLEQCPNSRSLFHLLSVKSKCILTAADIALPELVSSISRVGAFAEASNGATGVDPRWVWKNLNALLQKGGPLEGYDALSGSELLDSFRGNTAELQAIVCMRENEEGLKEVVVSFSGTERFSQVLCDADVRLVKFKLPQVIQEIVDSASAAGKDDGDANNAVQPRKLSRVRAHVHAGFYRLLKGLLNPISQALAQALVDSTEAPALTITGHSLGGALSFLLAVHILVYALLPSGNDELEASASSEIPAHIVRIPQGTRIRVVGFGTPRVGDAGLVKVYQALVEAYRARFGPDAFCEYSVKAYGDGIHCVPLRLMGFRHLCSNNLYLVHDHLFQVPASASNSEASVFPVLLPDAALSAESTSEGDVPDTPKCPLYPRGGHNYYNGRNMEQTLRRLQWLDIDRQGEDGWLERYQERQRVEDVSTPIFSCCCFHFFKTNHEM